MALSDVGANIATSLLAQTGSEWTYSRAPVSGTVNFYKSDLPPMIVEGGQGQVTEITMASFRGLVSEFQALFSTPLRQDRITDGTTTYEVQPMVDKCFYVVGGLIHIHAKQVKT